MRKSNTQPLGEVIDELLGALNIRGKLSQARVLNAWNEVLGTYIASHTLKSYIREKTLYVQLDSAVIRNELFMMKEQLIQSLNEKAGTKVIEKIVFR